MWQYASIYQRESLVGMFKKIISKLSFGSSKTIKDIDACKEFVTKHEGTRE